MTPASKAKVTIILANLGTPDAPTVQQYAVFLNSFCLISVLLRFPNCSGKPSSIFCAAISSQARSKSLCPGMESGFSYA